MNWQEIVLFSMVLGLFSFVCTLFLVPALKKFARYFNILDVPDGRIKKHGAPIPYLGGAAIFLFMVPSLLVGSYYEFRFLLVLIGLSVLFLVGLVDDIIVLTPGGKFLGQFIASLLLLSGGWYLHESLLALSISLLWLLIIINAFNLIDVMDGLATLVAAESIVGLLFIHLLRFLLYNNEIDPSMFFMCSMTIGALLGFFMFNKPPATIYLGDAGSLLLGGFLGVISLQELQTNRSLCAYSTPIVILAIPLLEIVTLIIIRSIKGIPFFKASPHHFSILLQHHGWSKKKILLYCAMMMFIAQVVISFCVADLISIYIVWFLAIIFISYWVLMLIYGTVKVPRLNRHKCVAK